MKNTAASAWTPLWNDDFHHIANVVMTGHNEAYCFDYCGTPQEFISAIKYGYLYQGQWYRWQQQPRLADDGSSAVGLRELPGESRSYRQFGPRLALPRDERGLYSHDKRDLRRQASVGAARLRCPGLERGGGLLRG